MKPETKGHLDRAAADLIRAPAAVGTMKEEPVTAEDVARNAYYAAFHAAKALIFERSGITQKRHGSVHKQFEDIAMAEPSLDPAFRTFLIRAYVFKRIGDYDIGAIGQIKPAYALLTLQEAESFVAAIEGLMSDCLLDLDLV